MQSLPGAGRGVPKLSVSDALLAVLVASVSVDGTIGVEETARMEAIISTSRALRVVGETRAGSAVLQAINLLNDHGAADVLHACGEALPTELRAPAFALAADLVLADGQVGEREKAFIDALQTALGLDDATALKVVEVMLIRNRA